VRPIRFKYTKNKYIYLDIEERMTMAYQLTCQTTSSKVPRIFGTQGPVPVSFVLKNLVLGFLKDTLCFSFKTLFYYKYFFHGENGQRNFTTPLIKIYKTVNKCALPLRLICAQTIEFNRLINILFSDSNL
jgi:hypothetical protein